MLAIQAGYLISLTHPLLSSQEYIDSLMLRLQTLPQQPSRQDASIVPEDASSSAAGMSSNQAQAAEASPQSAASGAFPASAFEPPPPSLLVRSLLCYTLLGHRCDLLTITDFSSPLEMVRLAPERELERFTIVYCQGRVNA